MRLVVAMSGGVDSSVAAALYLEKGADLIGITLNLFSCDAEEKKDKLFCGLEAAKVCGKLGIPHHILDARAVFYENVMRKSWDEYNAGRTPNPCVICNRHIKFGFLLDYALEIGAEGVISGHHAKIDHGINGSIFLRRGYDPGKDQSYFLSRLRKEQLEKLFMPLGNMTKAQVREEARRFGLHNSEKEESQDACIALSGKNFAETLRVILDGQSKNGNFVSESGEILGKHEGIHNFTIGQRRGFGRGFGSPVFVKKIDAVSGNVVLASDESSIFRKSFEASAINWLINDYSSENSFICEVQIRYRQKAVKAEIFPGKDNLKAEIVFEAPQRAVSPGQAVVFYDGDTVIGGGWID